MTSHRIPRTRAHVLLLAVLVLVVPALAFGQPEGGAAGRWQGTIDVGGGLGVDVHLRSAEDGWQGTIDIPAQGASGLPLADVTVDGDTIRFRIADTPGEPTFEGRLEGDVLAGTFSQSGQSFPFELQRIDASAEAGAPVATPAAPGPAAATPSPDPNPDEVYVDPAGAFTVPIPPAWWVAQHDGYATLHDPEDAMRVHVLTLEQEDLEAAVAEAWLRVDPAFDVEVDDVLEPPSEPGIERTVVVNYDSPEGEAHQAFARLHEGVAHLLLIDASIEAVQRRSAQLNVIASGYEILALEEVDLTGVEPRPADEVVEALAADIRDAMDLFGIPGVAVAIVQGDEVVFAEGFGVREAGGDVAMTPETHMMIGSTGKTMTTMLMGTLVDDGVFDWDTPVVEVLPEFEVADPELTRTMTMRNLVCACSGVPRRDLELFFNAAELSAEDVIESLATFEFFTDFGEAFQYSNQLVGAAGYAAAAAAGAEYGELFEAYRALLHEQVLGPIGMDRTTLSFEVVEERGEHAVPHSLDLETGAYVPIPLELERLLLPIAPAGAHWSTALDMARYLITQIGGGVAPDGTRVVSEDALRTTWEPQVPISATQSYGLGWIVDEYEGVPILSHGGNTLGFTSDFAFLPEQDLGVVVLTNAQGTNVFNQFVRERLLELVYEQPARVRQTLDFAAGQIEDALADVQERLAGPVNAEAVAAYVGTFSDEALGEITLALEDGRFTFDAGEFATELRPVTDDDGELDGYLMMEGPLRGVEIELVEDDAGEPVVELGEGVVAYTFRRSGE